MPEREHPAGGELSRRAVMTALLAGASGLLAACAAPLTRSSGSATLLAAPDATGAGGTFGMTAATVGAEATAATSTLGSSRARATANVGARRAGSPWEHLAPTGSWNLAFATWLVSPDARTAPASVDALRAQAIAENRIGSTAKVGAIVLHDSGAPGDISHVGFVEAITRYAIVTVEGDVPGPIPDDQTFVRRYAHPIDSPLTFYYPDYRS